MVEPRQPISIEKSIALMRDLVKDLQEDGVKPWSPAWRLMVSMSLTISEYEKAQAAQARVQRLQTMTGAPRDLAPTPGRGGPEDDEASFE